MIFEEGRDEYWSEKFNKIDFSGLTLSSKEFEGCTFTECDFSEAIFEHCNFVDCEFAKCNLSVANIKYSKFSEVTFIESKLIGVNWTNLTLSKYALGTPMKFYKCILNDSSFFGLVFHELIVEECKAHNVDFREGDFSRANFTYTDFTGSLFNRTNLTGTDFSEAINYDIDILENTIKNAKFSRHEAVRLLDCLEIELVD